MATLDFDAARSDTSGERPTFIVAGQTFTARARLPVNKFHILMAAMQVEGLGEIDAARTFFDTVLVKADRERFRALLDYDGEDDDTCLDQRALNKITEWALERYTGKDETSDETSTNGAPATGRSRKVVSLHTPGTES
jgi:hypothetical protein